MRISWQQRLALQPEYRDITAWPFIDVMTVDVAKRANFVRNQRIVAQILAGGRQKDAAQDHGLERSCVSRLLQHCLGGDDEEAPALTRGLIPHEQLISGRRRVPLSTSAAPAGGRGALTAVLEQLPAVRIQLDRIISASITHKAEGQNVMPKGFHAEFLRLLREAQWPTDRYPFCEESRGYEALRRYYHRCIAELRRPKSKPTRVIRTLTTQLRVFDEIQIDEQIFDAQGRVDLVLDEIHEPLRIGRISQALMVDKASDCRLGWQICLTRNPSQFDLLALLAQLHAPWQPLALTTPGLAYAPGACLPTALGFPFTHVGPGIVRFDNALSHIAHTVRDYLCQRLCATQELGLVAQPKGRNDVEHAFDLVSDMAGRFPSTTGSHPNDPRREARKLRRKPPVVTLRALEEMLSVLHTQHNITPQARLGGRTPLEVMQYQMEHGWLRLLPDARVQQLNPFLLRKKVTVYRYENGRPHVNFEYAKYSGEGLRVAETLKRVIIEYDFRDIRQLTVYTCEGHRLGEAQAPLSWQSFPHGITTRRLIHQETKRTRFETPDLLGGYLAHVLEHRRLPSQALELIRICREFQSSPAAISVPIEPSTPMPTRPGRGSGRPIPDWSTDLVQRGHHHE